MYRIAIVSPKASGGVITVKNKLIKALTYEGYNVDVFNIKSTDLNISYLSSINNHDVVIFLGSIPPAISLFIKTPKMLFVHGFVYYELSNTLVTGNLKSRIGALIYISKFEMTKLIEKQIYICHSITTCEMNKLLNKEYILLPQFVLKDDIKVTENLFNNKIYNLIKTKNKNKVNIVTYSSFVKSPRLLSDDILFFIIKNLDNKIRRDVNLIFINPLSSFKLINLNKTRIIIFPYIQHDLFISLLQNADIYIERSIDEELGYTSIEAALLGTPVAKISPPTFNRRFDYTDREVILSFSVSDFIEKLTDYINNVESYEFEYSMSIRKWVINTRDWDVVKHTLLKTIQQIANN
jgi:hypothetical protein